MTPTLVSTRHRRSRSTRGLAVRAFTLIEALVVVAIIGVLLGIVLVAVGPVRAFARSGINLSNLQQHVRTFTVYTNDYREQWPFLLPARPGRLPYPSAAPSESIKFFDVVYMWRLAMQPLAYANAPDEVFVNPDSLRFGTPPRYYSSYYYAAGFFTHWDYWDELTRLDGPAQLTARTVSDVAAPAKKGLFIDASELYRPIGPETSSEGNDPNRRISVAFADGSASRVRLGDLSRTYTYGVGFQIPFSTYTNQHRVVATMRGIKGTDIP